MAPPRQRAAALVDDSRSEASSGTREYRTTAPKSRRPANASKDKAAVTSAPITQEPVEELPNIPWSDLPLEILNAYRHAHKLPTPSAFSNEYSRTLLSQGIGLRSPTALAARRAQSQASPPRRPQQRKYLRHRKCPHSSEHEAPLRRIIGQDRVSKEQFAHVVRKHFNSAGLSEQEAIARFLYTVREERRGRRFRLHFQP
ncbi:hypothetical protein N7470_001159 [Penicillium chermesinum]|nr:hypothetical protein N7470_001159 [Penicillium chermesinum]